MALRETIVGNFGFLAAAKDHKPSKEGMVCGGIAGIACASGYHCIIEGTAADAEGKCAKQ